MNKLKKILSTAAILASTFTISANASVIEFQIGSTEFTTDNEGIISKNTIEAAPFINESNRTMVPIRAISDAFGAEISWDDTTKTVTITTADKNINLNIGSQNAYVNDVIEPLDCAPVIVNERTFVPIRFISENLGCNVNYAAATKHIIVDDTPIIIKCGDEKISLAQAKALYDIYAQTITDIEGYESYTEEDISTMLTNEVLNNSMEICYYSNAFSNLTPDSADIAEINAFINSSAESIKFDTDGLASLIHEDFYMWSPDTIILKLAQGEDVKRYYEKFFVRAKHVLVDDEETAKTVYEKAIAGEDFDALIAEYGNDPGMEQNPDGYVFTTGEMVPEFEKGAFELEVEKISEPIKTAYGYHVIKKEKLPEFTDTTALQVAQVIGNNILNDMPEPELLVSDEEIKSLLK